MRILLLTHYFEPEEGAPQRRWHALLERFVEAGHQVDVICPPPHHPSGRVAKKHQATAGKFRSRVTEYGVRVHRVSYLWHNGGIAGRTLDHVWVSFASVRAALWLSVTGQLRPDVIIATAPGLPTLVAGHSIARLLRRPLIAEMRDAWPDLVSYTPGLSRQRGAVNRIKHLVHKRITAMQRSAAHVVTTTENFALVLRDRGISHTTVIRNGTRLDRYVGLPKIEHDHGELRVLYIGTIGRSQGLDVLIRATARLREKGEQVHTRIVGHGADVRRLSRMNARLGFPVEILSSVLAADVYNQYVWADTCVVSLRDWEPFRWTVPSKLYELMASGRHITGLVDGEAAELIRATDSGDVVGPGDDAKLASLWSELSRDRHRLETSSRAREWVADNVDFDRLAQHYGVLLARVSRLSSR